ncbi:hypothetical protein BACCAP_01073 [Pseudoflavonifractor capillosus ATCC 29799]|uniref:Uncharacterized protein n=1 Tax=Pseudoflavonifractor capillosus ATCC 29799 TaxID=411467 RepID=A6NS94_9FIRM|nr:hypothetical protein BACCAP_01073 [Pseudoflavonifractor capillosus ATCC 29799]
MRCASTPPEEREVGQDAGPADPIKGGMGQASCTLVR